MIIEAIAGGVPVSFTYEWSRNGVIISGQTSSTLTISNVRTTDIGVYSVRAVSSTGSSNSSSTTLSVTGMLVSD